MGEAKRRKDLKLPARVYKTQIDKYNSFLALTSNANSLIRKYPYMGVATMILGVILFLASGGEKDIKQ